MSTVSLLLATKLYRPPPRSGLVPRLRRTARLSEGLAKPLTLVAAPTGFGKTTVVSEWIAGGQPSPIAWVSLDEDDNDPTRFFTYLVAALQNLQSDIGETALALLQSTPPSSPKTVLTALINDLS
jgi:ATP/maltotriose-dependent transcriptional regulator MalT